MKFLVVLTAVTTVAYARPGFTALGYSALPEVYSHGYTSFSIPTAFSRRFEILPSSAVTVTPLAAQLGVSSQYHTQDELGQASYGHSEPFQSHNAIQDAQGNKIGSFSYVSPDGQIIRTDYIADAFGYRVSSNALPVSPTPVSDTPEVVAARAAHFLHHSRAKRGILAVGHTPASTSPLGAGIPGPVTHISPLVYSSPLIHTAYITPYAYTNLHYSYLR